MILQLLVTEKTSQTVDMVVRSRMGIMNAFQMYSSYAKIIET